MENLLVSACLLGKNCKYSGGSNLCGAVIELEEHYNLISVCPEVEGGLPTPRKPAELKNGKVINSAGEDVTEKFEAGAKRALETAREYGCTKAVLKERSPSCGSGCVYDGTFSSKLVRGDGVTAALLKANGVSVYGESEIGGLTMENKVMEALLERRSVRRFKEDSIEREKLEAMARAAIYAPSGKGLQTWQMTVVSDRGLIGKLAKAIEEVLGRPGYDMYRPAAVIIPSNERESPYGREDDACALQNIFLAAHSMGIGSVWINQLQGVCDDPRIREVLDEMRIPADHVVYGLAALGYSAEEPKKDVVKKGRIVFVE